MLRIHYRRSIQASFTGLPTIGAEDFSCAMETSPNDGVEVGNARNGP